MNKSIAALVIILLLILAGGVVFYIRSGASGLSSGQSTTPTPIENNLNPSGSPTIVPTANIVETLNGLGAFRYFVAAIKLSSLNSLLNGDGPYTVFVPTDDAVSVLFDNPSNLPKTTAEIDKILRYHIVQGKITSADLLKSPTLKTLEGQNLVIKVNANTVMAGNAQIIDVDIPAKNGIIHVISSVLIPPK